MSAARRAQQQQQQQFGLLRPALVSFFQSTLTLSPASGSPRRVTFDCKGHLLNTGRRQDV